MSMINAELAAFLQEGLGVYVGSRDMALEPSGARGLAVRVEEDGAHLVVYVPQVAAVRILPDLQANGQVAVSVARPRDDRACQVKGVFADARRAEDHEQADVLAQWERFRSALEYIGISRQVTSGWVAWPAIAVRLKATAVFEQTPGPGTGGALK
jgi:hypothetical protein